jgi:hypothetical protein
MYLPDKQGLINDFLAFPKQPHGLKAYWDPAALAKTRQTGSVSAAARQLVRASLTALQRKSRLAAAFNFNHPPG